MVLPVAFYSRRRSHTGEKLDRWQEGGFILLGLRLGGIPCFLGSMAWMIQPQWMSWSALPLPIWVRWLGVGILVLWGCLLFWTFYHLGKNLTDTVVTRREHSLVTTGPYRFVRHPFYLAFFVGMIGFGLSTANWFLLATALVPAGFLFVRTPIEEAKLIERFGDDYRHYMAKTGRFLPTIPSGGKSSKQSPS